MSVNTSSDSVFISRQAQENLDKIDDHVFQIIEATEEPGLKDSTPTLKLTAAYHRSWGQDYFNTLSSHISKKLSRPNLTVELKFQPSHQLLFQQFLDRMGYDLEFHLSFLIILFLLPTSYLITILVKTIFQSIYKFARKKTLSAPKNEPPIGSTQTPLADLIYNNEKLKNELEGACHLWQATVDDLQSLKEKHNALILENLSLRERLKNSFKKIDFIKSDVVAKTLGISTNTDNENIPGSPESLDSRPPLNSSTS